MPSSGIAASPAEFLGVCPRCKIFRLFKNISQGGTNYSCNGCEWAFTIGTPTVNAPAVPGNGVAATNTTGSIVQVVISGGTLTAVVVNGVTVGTVAGTYLVPIGGTISITYSVAPTWTWALPVTNGAMVAGATAVPVANTGTNVPVVVGQTLFIDGTAPEILTVVAGSTATSIAVQPSVLAHNSAVAFGNMLLTPTLGVQKVPNAPGYGF